MTREDAARDVIHDNWLMVKSAYEAFESFAITLRDQHELASQMTGNHDDEECQAIANLERNIYNFRQAFKILAARDNFECDCLKMAQAVNAKNMLNVSIINQYAAIDQLGIDETTQSAPTKKRFH